jgi:HEAT repeat protein
MPPQTPPATTSSLASREDSQTSDAPVSALTSQQQRQMQIFGPILLNPSNDIDPKVRRDAAEELVAMHAPEAVEILAEALRSNKPQVMHAAVHALYVSKALIPELMDPAVEALASAPHEILEPLAWVVGRYGEPALQRVGELASRPSAAPAARTDPIYALAAFRSRAAAMQLMAIIEASSSDSNASRTAANSEIINAACASLERMSGLSYGRDVRKWRAWWAEASSVSDDQWFKLMADSLSDRVAQLQNQLQHQREAHAQSSRKLFEAYRDLYPALSTDEQLRRLPRLLEDELATVREFGMSRVSLLLRDSIRIPAEVQQKLAQRLTDENPTLRLEAARLLDELNYDLTGELIAGRLPLEKTSSVITGYLEVLAKRPCAAAIDPALKLLADREHSPMAAQALWRIIPAVNPDEQIVAAVRSAAREARDQFGTVESARLLALIGDRDDIAALTTLLDDESQSLRSAVAEGFAARGLRQPLIDRADDPAIFPLAVQSLAQGPADLGTFRLLAGLQPLPSQYPVWAQAVLQLARQLPPKQLLAADDVLSGFAYSDLALRRDVLNLAVAAPRDELAEARHATVVRLAPILIDLGDAARAFELIEGLNGDPSTPELAAVRFQAAALSGHYERAAAIQGNATAWVALLESAASRDLAAATPLRDEIERRFADSMLDADRAIFERVSEELKREASLANGGS